MHDTFKHGLYDNPYSVSSHPVIASKFIREYKQDILSENDVAVITNCIATHSGQWNTDYKTKEEIMDKPTTDMQKFVHLCDYLASRKILEVNFDAIG